MKFCKLVFVVCTVATGLFAYDLNIPATFDSLPNGLKVLIVNDTNVAIVSCRLYYFVGSINEGPGTAGLSHMFEHMLFKGTKKIGTTNYAAEVPIMAKIDLLESKIATLRNGKTAPSDSVINKLRTEITTLLDKQRTYMKKEELWGLYLDNGGTNLNAWTGDEMTAYIVTLPKNKLELFYWLESDRMQNFVLREFPSERDVVAEERRMRYDNRPFNQYWERLSALFYVASPYRNPTIGWMSDIQGYTREKLADHVARFYTPDNALLVLAGNVDSKTALSDIKGYFGSIPRAQMARPPMVTREPAPIGQTRLIVRDKAEPRIDVMYHTPGYPDHDLYALDVVQGILSGQSGRLYERLVTKENLCTQAGAENNVRLYDGYFRIYATCKTGVSVDSVEKIIAEELAKLTSAPPQDHELIRTQNTIRMSFVSDCKSLERLSDNLAWFERIGNWKNMLTYPDSIASVKPADIAPIVKKYLTHNHATVGMMLHETTIKNSAKK